MTVNFVAVFAVFKRWWFASTTTSNKVTVQIWYCSELHRSYSWPWELSFKKLIPVLNSHPYHTPACNPKQRWRRWTLPAIFTWLIHVTTLSVYCWWRLVDAVISYKIKIWDFETRIYLLNWYLYLLSWYLPVGLWCNCNSL